MTVISVYRFLSRQWRWLMGLDKSYLEYPLRRYGMDHDRYAGP